jgi:hypothetical protein
MPIKDQLAKGARRLSIAIGVAMLLFLLGIFNGVGYNINSISERITPSPDRTFADVYVFFDATYNPLLYPFYWLTGMGHISENFTSSYPLFIRPNTIPYGFGWLTQQERYDSYTTYMATRSIYGNLATLLLVTVVIEAAKQRLLYVVLFSGVVGFWAGGVLGTFIGLLLGSIAITAYKLKFANTNPFHMPAPLKRNEQSHGQENCRYSIFNPSNRKFP